MRNLLWKVVEVLVQLSVRSHRTNGQASPTAAGNTYCLRVDL